MTRDTTEDTTEDVTEQNPETPGDPSLPTGSPEPQETPASEAPEVPEVPSWTVVLYRDEVAAVFADGHNPVLPTMLGKTAIIRAESAMKAAALAVAHVKKLQPPQDPDIALNHLSKVLLKINDGEGFFLRAAIRQTCLGCGRDVAQRWRIYREATRKPGLLNRRTATSVEHLVTVMICPLCGPVDIEDDIPPHKGDQDCATGVAEEPLP